jgi:mono/diheme cytochrome c family protein
MKRALKIVGIVVGVVLLAAGGFAAKVAIGGVPNYEPGKVELKVEVTPERVKRGKKIANLLCAECHKDPTTGKLSGKRMEEAPPEFGPIFSRNLTRSTTHGEPAKYTDGQLAYLIRTGIGRDGRYVPPYMAKLPHLSDEDLASIIAFLRSDDELLTAVDKDPPGRSQPSFLTKFLCNTVFKPLPYPDKPIQAPPTTDKIAYGRYLVVNLDCWTCHSADFKTMNIFEPEKTPGFLGGGNSVFDLRGQVIQTANITPDNETGIGKWSEADFIRAVRKGFRPDNTLIRYPMAVMPDLTDEDASAMYAYLKTVPVISNKVARKAPELVQGDEGKKIYYKYGCPACHGDNGVGIGDLRKAVQHYPEDAKLLAWIKNAPSIKPDTKMPQWEGVIKDEEFVPLMAYVKTLQVP